jgi:thiol-disulfide isomerase/thioredoxin
MYEYEKPAAKLAYGYISENCSPIDAENPPRTNSNGEFTIDNLLPDELYSFWIFTDTNVFRVWKRLDPNIPTLQLTLKKSDYIELPEDWLYGGHTHHAIARSMGYAENSIIDFKLPDLNGKTISLSDDTFKNKAVVVNIAGTWCGGCIQETPYLVKFYDKYKDKGLEIISISFERDTKEALKLVSDFKKKNKINYTMLYGGISDKKNVESVITGLKLFHGYPTTIYISRDGKVQFIHSGFWIHTESHKKWQLDLMENHINEILADVNSSK